MVKRALLVGLNYPGTNHALNGCVNDVASMEAMLTNFFGFDEITKLVDTDAGSEQPTGVAIKRHLTRLVQASAPGDALFFHYSGHGTQVPSDGEESDAKDEALCPADMNVITDDDLRTIFSQLADGVKLTMVADCCHSGTLLDQPLVQIAGPKSDDPQPPQLEDTFSPDSREVAGRRLPTEHFLQALSDKLGVSVAPNQVRAALVAAFGADASAKLAPLADKLNAAVSAAGGVEALASQAADKLDSLIPGAGGAAAGLLGAAGGLLGGLAGSGPGGDGAQSRGFGSTLFNLALGLLSEPDVQLPPAGAKPSPEAQLPDGKGVLITGCQAHETSADACPSGDPSQAFGALTNALTSLVQRVKEADPNSNISARSLVHYIREHLNRSRFAQNPCLECDDASADDAFIVPAA